MSRQIFDEIKDLITESRNPATREIDAKSTAEILQLINNEDRKIADIVAAELPYIAQANDLLVEKFKEGKTVVLHWRGQEWTARRALCIQMSADV